MISNSAINIWPPESEQNKKPVLHFYKETISHQWKPTHHTLGFVKLSFPLVSGFCNASDTRTRSNEFPETLSQVIGSN